MVVTREGKGRDGRGGEMGDMRLWFRVGIFYNRGLVERHLAGCWEGVRG